MEPKQLLMKCLVTAHRWELTGHPLFGTYVGRHVCMCIIGGLNELSEIDNVKSLKQIFSSTSITDRAIRLKLRDLEKSGYIEMDSGSFDSRYRKLIITEKFKSIIGVYEKEIFTIFCKELVLLKK